MKQPITTRIILSGTCLGALALAVCGVSNVHAADPMTAGLPPEAVLEIKYVEGLQQLRLPDYANIVIGRLEVKYGAKVRMAVEVMKVSGLLQLGKFEEVKALIAKKPKQKSQLVWALKLALGDGYYAWGKYNEASGVYTEFFKAYPEGPPADLKSFYVNSAYKFAQMLILMGNNKAALSAYDYVLKAKPVKHVKRQVQGETAELLVKLAEGAKDEQRKKYCTRAEKLCNEILWIQDLWFGKAIVYLAHIRKLQGDIKGAKELIKDYTSQLSDIDKALKAEADRSGVDMTRLSPMAQCRYLIAVMLQEEANRKLKAGDKKAAVELLIGAKQADGKRETAAYQHFVNVFIRYAATKWAPDAGRRAREIEEMLTTEFGARITSKITPKQMAEVERYQFLAARSLFNQNRFKEAIDSYVDVLSLFPEQPTSVAALGELARCYLEQKQLVYAEMVGRYIAERFGRRENLRGPAGDRFLRFADTAADEFGHKDLRNRLHQLYFTAFKGHSRAPNLLFRFGKDKLETKEFNRARKYFVQIMDDYPNAMLYFPAMSQVANCYSEAGDRTNEIRILKRYIKELDERDTPGYEFVNGKYRLAVAHKELGGQENIRGTIEQADGIVKLVRGDDNRYYKTQDDKEKNRQVLEGTIFLKAHCMTLLTEPEEQVQAYQQQAVKDFEDLIKEFPKSKFAPVALSRIGVLWTILENPEETEKALRRLEEEYPETEEAKNAKFMLAKSLLEIGKRKEAIKVFKEMFSGAGKYSAAQILTAGRELLKVEDYDIALEAFDKSLAMANGERAIEEPALLGKGKVLAAKEKYDAAGKALTELLTKYPKTGFMVEACKTLSAANAALARKESDEVKRFDLFNDAVKAMQRILKLDKTPARRVEVSVAVGRVLEMKAEAEKEFSTDANAEKRVLDYKNEAIAAYQTVIMLVDPNEEGVGTHLQDAYFQCIPIMLETATDAERAKQAAEDCDTYIGQYPDGKYILDMQRLKSQAKIKVTQLASAPPPVETPPTENK